MTSLTGCNTGSAGNQAGDGGTGGDTTGGETNGADTTAEGNDGAGDLTGLVCDTDGIALGDWDEDVEDWSNPGGPGFEFLDLEGLLSDPLANGQGVFISKPGIACEVPSAYAQLYGSVDETIAAHHCYTTAVHAVHVRGEDARAGALLVMHGENDERLWDIGSDPSEMTWHPIAVRTRWEEVEGDAFVERCNLPDIFCSGHVQLYDGRVFVAGGNVDGSPGGGAIHDTYVFDPVAAQGLAAPGNGPLDDEFFGWSFRFVEAPGYWESESPPAEYDRWYPTLTALPDGRVLIAGGDSREVWHEDPEGAPAAALTRVLEVLDPTVEPMTLMRIPGGTDALFPDPDGMPEYPFTFVLPNGDVFYAGAEGTDAERARGQVLVVDYDRQPDDAWFWLDVDPTEAGQQGIDSTITGGSAVMYRPGKVLKTGGLGLTGDTGAAVATAEVIDLTAYTAGARPTPESPEPEVLPPAAFTEVTPMHHARHFHTLTMLPDGRVLATGGNRYGNSSAGENFNNPCEILGTRIDTIECDEGCPSVCTERRVELPFADPDPDDPEDNCDAPDQITRCSLIDEVPCRTSAVCDAADDPETPEDECPDDDGCERVGADCVPNYDYGCEDVLAGSYCDGTRCRMDCSSLGSLCGLVMPVNGECLFEADPVADAGKCSPMNSACYATQAAEIWDPECDVWTETLEQEHPRMYHSTAVLLPDARVISMGGGHRGVNNPYLEEQVVSEYFAPTYSAAGAAPAFDDPGAELVPIENLAYPAEMFAEVGTVMVDPDVDIDHAALLRLGSVTHGIDMSQSYLRLGIDTGNVGTLGTLFETSGQGFPFSSNTAPPGDYLLFLVSGEGEPSDARYVSVGAVAPARFYCEPSTTFAATETACASEPVEGACPAAAVQVTAVDPPTVVRGSGPAAGFLVVSPPGSVRDPSELSPREHDRIEALCVTACEQHFAGQPGQSANCGEPGAFASIELELTSDHRVQRTIHSTHRHGEGLFGSAALACDLADDCHSSFDEALGPVAYDRVTPASAPLGFGTEWRVSIAGAMSAWASTGGNPSTSSLVGSIAYSQCAGGNASAPCAFYLGAMEFSLSEELALPMQCGSSTATHVLSDLTVRLEQPAFGMAEQGTAWKAFTPGAIVLDAEGEVNGIPFHVRRANQEPLYLRAGMAWTLLEGADGAWLEFSVPCDGEMAEVLVWWGYSGVGVEDAPPQASTNFPTSIACPSTRTLTKSVSDADGDLASVRWFVDDVLMVDGLTSMTFTTGHTLRLVARDERGAATTATKVVSCQ
jgi:hypothetical protein